MDPVGSQTALEAIVSALRREMPDDSSGAFLDWNQIGWKSVDEAVLNLPGGAERVYIDVNSNVIEDLRDATASTGTGAWFHARITVQPDGEFEAQFDYDVEPDLDIFDILPDDIEAEFQRWPRSREHVPDWLMVKIDEFGLRSLLPPSDTER